MQQPHRQQQVQKARTTQNPATHKGHHQVEVEEVATEEQAPVEKKEEVEEAEEAEEDTKVE